MTLDEKVKRVKYGMFEGHFKWDLAKTWLTTSNDGFYELYGFNWIPPLDLQDEVRLYL
jgi:hypothetical protein